MPLPHASLPLSFSLLRNGRRESTTPCLDVTLHGCQIHRILDPEFREPFISCSRIFAAAKLTPLDGIFRFKLQPFAYDSMLAGLAPYDDIWVSLTIARRIANELGIKDELAGLLDWDSRFAWTVADKEENALRHNWRIPPNSLSEGRYSTAGMLDTTFPALVMLGGDHDLRTHIPPLPDHQSVHAPSWESQWRLLVRWSLLLYEEYLEGLESIDRSDSPDEEPTFPLPSASPSTAKENDIDLKTLTPSFLWTALTTQLQLTTTENLPLTANGRVYTFAHGRLESRQGSSDLVARMALVDALARLALIEWQRQVREADARSKRDPSKPATRQLDLALSMRSEVEALEKRADAARDSMKDELALLRERMARLEERIGEVPFASLTPRKASPAPSFQDVSALATPSLRADHRQWTFFLLGSLFTLMLAFLLRRLT